MTTRQLIFLVVAVSVLAGGLAWYLERFKIEGLHSEIKDYLKKHAEFRDWEASQ